MLNFLSDQPLDIGEMNSQNMMHSIIPLMKHYMYLNVQQVILLALHYIIATFHQNMNYFWIFMFASPAVIAVHQRLISVLFIKLDAPVFYLRQKY